MEHKDFRIGLEFWTATGAWRCTDVGTRTIVAIKLEAAKPWGSEPTGATAGTAPVRSPMIPKI